MEERTPLRAILAVACAALLAACGSQEAGNDTAPAAEGEEQAARPAAAAPRPDLAGCPPRELLEEGLRQRTEPIPVPAALRAVMASGMDNFAVTSLEGSSQCVDASWMEAIHDPRMSADGRFVSFDWEGYEAYGHVIVDRSGAGQVLDTGVAPMFSPSGRRFAAADLGEAGFGALNAFAVWRIEPAGVREVARLEDIPSAYDWRIEQWAGETCVELSSVLWDNVSHPDGEPREHFRAWDSSGWRLEPGFCPDA